MEINNQFQEPVTYAVKHKDEEVRAASRSGGVFSALSDFVFDCGGVVYGCVLTKDYTAAHIRAENKACRDQMRGSKYIESKIQDTFRNVKEDLLSGKEVLFSGTPCQTAGLKTYIGKDYPNLMIVDILCHGVPSPKVWSNYLQWQEKKYGSCISVDFRNKKKFGWSAHMETMSFSKNGQVKTVDSRVFTNIFYKHLALRPSCYECKYKTIMHPGDITIADYWEIDRALPGFNDNKGVSLVMINNQRGLDFFEKIKPDLDWKMTKYADSTRPSMFHPADRPAERDQFWFDFLNYDFGYVVKKYGNDSLFRRIKRIIKRII